MGNPTGFDLTGGQASDVVGADHLRVGLETEALLADNADDADERGLEVLKASGTVAVIPPKRNRLVPREDDKELSKARHLIEHFFSKIKPFRAIATRDDQLARNCLASVHFASAYILLN